MTQRNEIKTYDIMTDRSQDGSALDARTEVDAETADGEEVMKRLHHVGCVFGCECGER